MIPLLIALFNMTLSANVQPVVLAPGDAAPDFTAQVTDGSHVALHDYKGKSNVVLYFYPEDMTGGCTIEACNFRDDQSKYKAVNTVVFGVSMDPIEMHKQFTEKDNLNFPLLVDTDRKIIDAYGVPVDGHHAKRWTFLIGKDGKIAKAYQQVDARIHSQELLKDIAELNAKH